MIYFQSLTKEELAQMILPLASGKALKGPSEELEKKAQKQARYRSKQIFHWVYQRFVTDFDQMSDLSKDLRTWLKANIEFFELKEKFSKQAMDGTHKFLWELPDNKTIESVIIPAALKEKKESAFVEAARDSRDLDEIDDEDSEEGSAAKPLHTGYLPTPSPSPSMLAGSQNSANLKSSQWSRLTVCISSQVGCAMACKFCLTGVQGLDRHLQTHEIVTQVHALRRLAPITNIVFMGMGEPLHNFENVAKACQILLDQDGLGFSKRKVTVSTSGLVPAIIELGKRVDVSLAISLNSSTDEQRDQIMPVNKRWNIAALLDACRQYPLGPHRRLTFEYVLLKDFNDTIEDADRVLKLLRDIPSKVNLIPFNEHSGSIYKRPDDEVVRKFQRYLLDRGMTATVRISRGRDILAACGQLRSIFGTARGTDKHKDRVDVIPAPETRP